MNCKHKPQDPRLIISTQYGKFYTFDHSQNCRKCGKQIVMVHKLLYKFIVAIMALSNILWFYLFFYCSNMPFARIIVIAIMLGIMVWLPGYSGNLMKWRKNGLSKMEKR